MPERGWLLPAGLLTIACASLAVYQTAPRTLAEVAIWPYAAAVWLGPSLVHPTLRRRGASARAAVAAALVVPMAWLLKECYRITAVFGVHEAFYYALNPLCLGLFAAAALQISIAELAVGSARRTPLAVMAGILVLAVVLGLYASESGGREAFYAYIALYRKLFGG